MRLLVLLPFLLLSGQLFGQLDMNTYLGSNTSAYELKVLEQQRQYMRANNFSSPILREIEVRMRTRELGAAPDDFRFRVSPINPWERKANKSYNDLLNQQLYTQWQVEFSMVLYNRYMLLVELFYQQQLLETLQLKARKYERLSNAYRDSQDAAKELIRLKKRTIFNELTQHKTEGVINRLVYEIKLSHNTKDSTRVPDIIDPVQIASELTLSESSAENIFVQNEMNKSKLSEAEWQINKSETFSNMGFLQAEYRPDDGIPFSEALGWQIGFQIPLFNKDRPDLQRRRLEVIEDQEQVNEKKLEVDLKSFNYENDLRTLLIQFRKIEQSIKSLEGMDVSRTSNIEVVLELDEMTTELNDERLDVYRRILVNYLGWLDITGNLVKQPLINHLDPKKSTIVLAPND